MQSINPVTEKVIQQYQAHNLMQITKYIAHLEAGFNIWRNTSFTGRSAVFINIAKILEQNKQQYANLITLEMGKLNVSAIAEIDKCIWCCNYYAKNAAAMLSTQTIESNADNSYISFEPLGIVLGIMPWNFPFWQAFRYIVPTLMAGNVTLLKHASNVSGCALAIENIFNQANSNILKTILFPGRDIAEVIMHSKIAAVTLTGSVSTGKSVAAAAGANIKKTVLELGGNDPYLILADANIKFAAKTCATSRLNNSGQVCIAAKRCIVVASVYENFLQELISCFKNADALAPLASKQILEAVTKQVAASIQQGATCVLGGKSLQQTGYFYPATILTDIPLNSPAHSEEIFGPVAAVFKVQDTREAIALANDSEFGLGAAIFSKNLQQAQIIAREIQAGSVFINSQVSSDPRLPFGGIKHSGYGRELADFGIKEFVNIKTISTSSPK
ncbi:MAG: succinate-semialdehyde dehydrogenase [Legionellales bacterium]|nr:MAG: succinate-semialdehyde dehydrogenase [Legionellales bacterium]